ncbi:YdeI/OmpD-associated family protein [Aquabacter spiritensis]|uniref:Uncharacterized protein YdeI (YjbR/CyaY-like superfamily) n=1 Tax=Aquabacter spiritensis TaxID=933073 RepID=A0A4R3MA81_9HYPH|nr:uncharacterized protein YdeI (YjbR/CyaY-like superfamily) [Aquabacter spiritensis]
MQRWREGLNHLRGLCRQVGLVETVKWGHPCYRHADRNVVIIGAFRGDFRLSFFDAALMQDPAGMLEKQGPNTRHPDMIRFTTAARVAEMEPSILAYLTEAMGHAEAGIRPPRAAIEIDLPDELAEALAADPDLAAAFQGLTPGRQRSYVIHLTTTKSPATRRARIEKVRDKILAGKGATER